MKLVENLFSPLQNCEEATCVLSRALGVNVTKATLVKDILEHPDYPSLLSVSDVMESYGVSNVSLRVKEPEKLLEQPVPFLANVTGQKSNAPLFTVIYQVKPEQVEWHNPETHKRETIPFQKFQALFMEYVQLYEMDEHAGEKEYAVHSKKEKIKSLLVHVLAFSIPVLTLIISLFAFIINGINALFPVLYTLLALIGAITGALLILYEIDQHNHTL